MKYKTAQKQLAKKFLEISNAEIIAIETYDTYIRTVYEISTDEGIEVWVERESTLNNPVFYTLNLHEGYEE